MAIRRLGDRHRRRFRPRHLGMQCTDCVSRVLHCMTAGEPIGKTQPTRRSDASRTHAAKGTRGPLVKDPPLCPHTTLLGVPPLVRTRKRPRQEPMRSLAQPFSSPSSHVKAYGRALLSTRRASQLSSQLPIGRATFLPVISTPQPARRPWISSNPASWGPWPDSGTSCPTAHHR